MTKSQEVLFSESSDSSCHHKPLTLHSQVRIPLRRIDSPTVPVGQTLFHRKKKPPPTATRLKTCGVGDASHKENHLRPIRVICGPSSPQPRPLNPLPIFSLKLCHAFCYARSINQSLHTPSSNRIAQTAASRLGAAGPRGPTF